MTAPVLDVARLDRDITAALAEVREARIVWAHNPTTDNVLLEKVAQARLDRLLEFRFRAQPRP